MGFASASTPRKIYAKYKQSAKHRGIPFDITLRDVMELWKEPCLYCGDFIGTVGIDRVINDRPYERGNIVPCCGTCNWMKRALSVDDFIAHCMKIANMAARREW